VSVARSSILENPVAFCSTAMFLVAYRTDKPFSTRGELAGLPVYPRCATLSSFAKPAARYHGRFSLGSGSATAANDVPITPWCRMGMSLYMPDPDTCVPGAAEFRRAIEREPGAEAGAART
jgi:hypothetical protein